MASTQKFSVGQCFRHCCCSNSFSFFGGSSSKTTNNSSQQTVRLKNGEVIVTQPCLSNENALHMTNGKAKNDERSLRALGVQAASQEKEFDEIDLDDSTSYHNPNDIHPQTSHTPQQQEAAEHLEAKAYNADTKADKTPSTSTRSHASSSGIGTASASSKQPSTKSQATTMPAEDHDTQQLTNVMLSNVIQEHFDAADLPEIIEEDMSNVDFNAITEVTEDELQKIETQPAQLSRQIPTIQHISDTDSRSSSEESKSETPRKVPHEKKETEKEAEMKTNVESKHVPEGKNEKNSNNNEKKDDSSSSESSQRQNVNKDVDANALSKYGGLSFETPKNQMYGDLDEDDESDSDDEMDDKKEREIITATKAVASNDRTSQSLHNEQQHKHLLSSQVSDEQFGYMQLESDISENAPSQNLKAQH